MARDGQETHGRTDHFILKFTLVLSLVYMISGTIGYVMFNASVFENYHPCTFLQSIYQIVKSAVEIGVAMGITLCPISVQIFEILCTKSHENLKYIFILAKIILLMIGVIIAFMIGISVAEKRRDENQVQGMLPELPDVSDLGKKVEFSSDEVAYLESICLVEIDYTSSIISHEDEVVYRIDDFEMIRMSIFDRIKNPFSSFVHFIKHTEYVKKYKITLQPIYEEDADFNKSFAGSSMSNDVLVIIKEILVKKDGKPLIGLNSIDPQYIWYGTSKDNLEQFFFEGSSQGYTIEFPQGQDRYIAWNDRGPIYVDESNLACFEDYIMDTNLPFTLNAENLKALFDGELPAFTDNDLKISIKIIAPSTDISEEPSVESPPLEMSTREGRILYHWQYGQDSFYFAINYLAGGHKIIRKENFSGGYRLLCELTIE